ncbi:hypothetical protein AB0H73_05870 [Streptomyces olivoreticuli]
MTKPTIGRVVHYRSHGTPKGEFSPECRAAIITEIDEQLNSEGRIRVGLAVLNPEGLYFSRSCPQDETASRGGTWHWPEKKD